jgi:cyanate permease
LRHLFERGQKVGVLNRYFDVGPLLAGRIFDVTGSYASAFELFAVMLLFGAAATYACLPLESEQARVGRVVPASA